jgi:hypothetical protein
MELAYMPENNVERLGAHTGAVENARVNRTPSFAIRSSLGVYA